MKNASLPLRYRYLVALLVIVLLSACSRKMVFVPSPVVPAASGQVKYKKDRNGNYSIRVKTRRLAPSSSLKPPRDTYVVWMETEYNGIKNVGKINSSSGLLSKTLKASLEAVTPYRPRGFFITAEDRAEISYPGPEVVLRTH